MSSIVALSEAASLALHSMAVIAREKELPVPLTRITASTGISSTHLAKVLQRLVKAGLLLSTRGPKGGFQVAAPLDALSLLDIYEAIEGPMEIRSCLFSCEACPFGFGKCLFGNLLDETNRTFRDYLAATTLDRLTREGE